MGWSWVEKFEKDQHSLTPKVQRAGSANSGCCCQEQLCVEGAAGHAGVTLMSCSQGNGLRVMGNVRDGGNAGRTSLWLMFTAPSPANHQPVLPVISPCGHSMSPLWPSASTEDGARASPSGLQSGGGGKREDGQSCSVCLFSGFDNSAQFCHLWSLVSEYQSGPRLHQGPRGIGRSGMLRDGEGRREKG